VKVIGEPVSPEAVAVTVLVPVAVPSRYQAEAYPLLSVLMRTDVWPLIEPPPVMTLKSTGWLATGLALASVTRTTKGAARMRPTLPLLPLPEVSISRAAGAGVAEILKVTVPAAPTEVAWKTLLVSPTTVPTVGLIEASPSAEVLTFRVDWPLILPPPETTEKRTATPEMALP